jgi:acetolactate synthase-1/2/3 large subunit
LLDAFAAAEAPLILAGGGISSGGVRRPFVELVTKLGAPVVHSLMGADVLPREHPLRVGMIGSYGNRWANHAIVESDFLLVIGSRLDVRQTGSEAQRFKGERALWHVDCSPGEMNHRVTGCETVLSHLQPFLAEALEKAARRSFPSRSEWIGKIRKMQGNWPDTAELGSVSGINPNVFMHALASASAAAGAYVVDVGQHQMWAAQSIDLAPGQRFLTSGGMGAMGFALPTAIGAAMASAGKPIVMLAGDGSMQLNIQELQTVFREKLPLKMVVLNNECHGMVRQFQQSYFEGRYQSTYWGYSAPSFRRVAEAYGIASAHVAAPEDVGAALEAMWRDPAAPYLLEVKIDPLANAYPKIAFGRPISEMEPQATPLEMEGT